MLTRDDIIDIIIEAVQAAVKGQSCAASSAVRGKRIFMSDWELKKLRVPGCKTITVPEGTIISPLAQDWIDFEGIEVLFK